MSNQVIELSQRQRDVLSVIDELYLSWWIDGVSQGSLLVKAIDDATTVDGVTLGEHELTFEVRRGGVVIETLPMPYGYAQRVVKLSERINGGEGTLSDNVLRYVIDVD